MPDDAVLILLALREFKAVNDTNGKAFGDRFLVAIAERLAAAAGEWPSFRFGGTCSSSLRVSSMRRRSTSTSRASSKPCSLPSNW